MGGSVFVSYVLLCVHSKFVIIFKGKRELVGSSLLPNRCLVTISVLWLFLRVSWSVCSMLFLIILTYFFTRHLLFLNHLSELLMMLQKQSQGDTLQNTYIYLIGQKNQTTRQGFA